MRSRDAGGAGSDLSGADVGEGRAKKPKITTVLKFEGRTEEAMNFDMSPFR
jgi:hypothetical protein